MSDMGGAEMQITRGGGFGFRVLGSRVVGDWRVLGHLVADLVSLFVL